MQKKEIFDLIVKHAIEVLPELEEYQFQYSDTLIKLGANSLDRSEIVMMTLQALSLNVPLLELAKATNMGELADILHQRYSR